MMKVIGEEGTSLDDFIVYLKSDFLDSVYLQQNGFDEVDAVTKEERQKYVFSKVVDILKKDMPFKDKAEARTFFYNLRHTFIDWNYKEWEKEVDKVLESGVKEEAQAK